MQKIFSLLAAVSCCRNVESLGHRKGHGVNYFGGHGVIIIKMLRISHEICLVCKEFEESFKSMKLSLLVPVRTLEAERRHFQGWSWWAASLMEGLSPLGDGSGSSRELVFAQFLSAPTNAAVLWEVIETPNIPVSIAQQLLSTSPLDYCWLLLLSPWNSNHLRQSPSKMWL